MLVRDRHLFRNVTPEPDKAASPLGRRPYDLRHTCITNWLNAGVPVAEVARRAGNSPEVIHRRHEGFIDGHEELTNRKIEMAMGLAGFEPAHTAPESIDRSGSTSLLSCGDAP